MRFWSSHMEEPDWPLLERQVWLMMLAQACGEQCPHLRMSQM